VLADAARGASVAPPEASLYRAAGVARVVGQQRRRPPSQAPGWRVLSVPSTRAHSLHSASVRRTSPIIQRPPAVLPPFCPSRPAHRPAAGAGHAAVAPGVARLERASTSCAAAVNTWRACAPARCRPPWSPARTPHPPPQESTCSTSSAEARRPSPARGARRTTTEPIRPHTRRPSRPRAARLLRATDREHAHPARPPDRPTPSRSAGRTRTCRSTRRSNPPDHPAPRRPGRSCDPCC